MTALRSTVVLAAAFGLTGCSSNGCSNGASDGSHNGDGGAADVYDGMPDAGKFSALSFYASPTGSGTACTNENPCSLAQLQAKVRNYRSGNTVYAHLKGGTYYLSSQLNFNASDSGTSSNPIYWTNAPGETPIISGGQLITINAPDEGSKWVSTGQLDWNVRTLRLPGAMGTSLRARAHNGASRNSMYSTGYTHITAKGSGFATVDSLPDWPSSSYAKGEVVWFKEGDDGFNRTPISSRSGNTVYSSGALGNAAIGGRVIIENVPESVDAADEWALDLAAAKLHYYPRAGAVKANGIIAPKLSRIISISEASYINFSNIHFADTTDIGNPAVDVANSHYITFTRCSFYGVYGAMGISNSYYTTLSYNHLYYLGLWGVQDAGYGTAANGNRMKNIGEVHPGGAGIWFVNPRGVNWQWNYVAVCHGNCVKAVNAVMWDGKTNNFYYNTLRFSGLGLADIGSYGAGGANNNDMRLRYNFIDHVYGIGTDSSGTPINKTNAAIYLDCTANHHHVEANVIGNHGGETECIRVNGGNSNTLNNNAMICPAANGITLNTTASDASGCGTSDMTNNVYSRNMFNVKDSSYRFFKLEGPLDSKWRPGYVDLSRVYIPNYSQWLTWPAYPVGTIADWQANNYDRTYNAEDLNTYLDDAYFETIWYVTEGGFPSEMRTYIKNEMQNNSGAEPPHLDP